jgi:hypothetical protein
MRVLLSVVAGIGLLAGPLAAQAPRGPVPVRAGLTAASSELRSASSATLELRRQVGADSLPQTQWLKGGIIGALLLGVPSTLLWGELARYSDQSGSELGGYLAGFAVGGGMGFFIGALIGGQFEK